MSDRISWDTVLRRIADGEDAEAVLDEQQLAESASFVDYMRSMGRPDLADRYSARVRDIETGVYGARNTWMALSTTQRRALDEANKHGGRVNRVGRAYRHGARNQPYRPIYVATIRNLCARDLMAWDGGAFEPEAAAAVTERGRFVLAHWDGK